MMHVVKGGFVFLRRDGGRLGTGGGMVELEGRGWEGIGDWEDGG